jgi:hypothetical protein
MLLALALSATASPALAQSAAEAGGRSAGRPILLGLVAALFLVMGALVGAADKHHGGKPKSRR